jgi:hypothetical protein
MLETEITWHEMNWNYNSNELTEPKSTNTDLAWFVNSFVNCIAAIVDSYFFMLVLAQLLLFQIVLDREFICNPFSLIHL